MQSNSSAGGYFLYHSIGMYPGKEEDLARAMAEFAQVWAAPNDKQWGYVLRKRQDFLERWGRLINAPKGSITAVDNVTEGMQKLMRALPEGQLRGKRVLVAGDCFPRCISCWRGWRPGWASRSTPCRCARAPPGSRPRISWIAGAGTSGWRC
ncbi:hypothetical protein ACFSZS_21000 [Seohaeicola zhoushanensis]